jgi:iron complex outermembrane receptor protein
MRHQFNSLRGHCLLLAASAICPLMADAAAQTSTTASAPTEPSGEIQEIIVTAEKREENLKDVPVPVSVISADSLIERNQVLLIDYATTVPAFAVTPVIGSQQSLSIRGVTTGGLGIPTVGVLIDDIPFGDSTRIYVPDFDPGDIAQIEVLRGPQGTLYGADSMGGLLKYDTVQPNTERLSGNVLAGVGGIENGNSAGYTVRGSLNIPLTQTLAARISAFDREDPGYINNILLNKDAINGQRVYGGRAALRWSASDEFSATLSALYQHTAQDGSSDFNIGLKDLQQNEVAGAGVSTEEIQAYSATLKAKAGIFDITSLSGYSINQTTNHNDLSVNYGGFTERFYGAGGALITFPSETKKFTEELRVSFPVVNRLDAFVGLFYTHESLDDLSYFQATDVLTGQIVQNEARYHDPRSTYEEYAVFGNLDYHITDQFDVQFGIRASHIDNVFQPYLQWPGFSSPLPPSNTVCDSSCITPGATAKASPINYLVTPRYKISEDVMVYFRFATGYRPGGANVNFGSAPQFVPQQYNPDETKNYELGVKADFLDHKLAIDASLYYIDWSNIQIQLEVPVNCGCALPGNLYQGNGAGAKSEGLELSATLKPLTGMTIGGWIAYDNAVLTQSFSAGTFGLAGDRLPFSPTISGRLSIEQRFPIGNSATGSLGADESYVGDRIGIFQNDQGNGVYPPRHDYPGYATFDLHAGLQSGSWSANLYANNVLDRRGLLGDGGSFQPTVLFYIKPRTFGVNMSKSF